MNTTNFGFPVPDYGTKPWHTQMFECFASIDNALAEEHKNDSGNAVHGDITVDSISFRGNGSLRRGGKDCLVFVPADRLGDGTYSPYTDDVNFNQTLSDGSRTVNWALDFGVPSEAKALLIRVQTSTSHGQTPDRMGYVYFRTSEGATFNHHIHTHVTQNVAGFNEYSVGFIPIPNSTSYVTWRSDKAGQGMFIRIHVLGYWV